MNRLPSLRSLSALSLVLALSATGCRNTEAAVASAPAPQASPAAAVGSVARESTTPIAAASRGPRAPRAPCEKEDALSLAISRQASVSAGGGRRAYLFRAVGVKDDDRTDWYPRLEAKRCYTFVGAGVDKVKELSVYLWDGAGKRITENRASGPSAVMSHCPKVSGPYHIQAKMTDGAGAYGIGVYAK